MTLDLFAPAPQLPRVTRSDRLTAEDAQLFGPGDRVIMAAKWGAEGVADAIRARGAEVILAQHWMETEHVFMSRKREAIEPECTLPVAQMGGRLIGQFFDPAFAANSRTAFEASWSNLQTPPDTNPIYTPAEQLVPLDWVPLLPYPTFNPAQAEALPAILDDGSVMVVAPTGAGKTVIGMTAALNEIKNRGGAAAWLVPQRSLTAELDRDLELWRQQGLKVERLSGEFAADQAAIAEADLLVATTEKFEALCRSASLAEVIARVGTVVVDEIHLLGEQGRGATLEALLARIRQTSNVKLVGLSATVANAAEVAEWLDAKLVRIAWRPTRLSQQVLTVPTADREELQRYRTASATHIVREISSLSGSTLVFCGSKFSIRAQALDIARDRGQDVHGIDPNDIEGVAEVAHAARVGIHYSDWPHRHLAEEKFRNREFDVLVATSTMAAGVNTPARAVVVRDTSIGPTMMEVSMIQQMVGRAGRAGKESEGFAYIITQSDETAIWRQRLADGYTVTSRILATLNDHLLGEIVQGRIKSEDDARAWWRQTLAYHQGSRTDQAINEAMERLDQYGFTKLERPEDKPLPVLIPTRLGTLTSRMMINVSDAIDLRRAIQAVTILPTRAEQAERHLIDAISNLGTFRNLSAPQNNEQRAAILRAIPTESGKTRSIEHNRNGLVDCGGADVVRAALWLAAVKSDVFVGGRSVVAGIQKGLLYNPLDSSPRYLAWIAAQGTYGTIPTWSCVVAADLGKRVRWHALGPKRGEGRILRAAEAAAGNKLPEGKVRAGYEERRGTPGPTLRVSHKATGRDLSVRINAPEKSQVFVLNQPARQTPSWQRSKPGQSVKVQGVGEPVAVAFLGNGDVAATGWLAAFAQ